MLRQILFLGLVAVIWGFQRYQSLIPNGNSVPNPCNSSTTWPGVGHFLPQGSGLRNPFGVDFAAANYTWTHDLCQKDSDGDGLTNGEELGDPNCRWSADDNTPHLQAASGHPGICEPIGSGTCRSNNFQCHQDVPVGK